MRRMQASGLSEGDLAARLGEPPKRPGRGPVAWIHLGPSHREGTATALAERLAEEDPDIDLVATADRPEAGAPAAPPAPADHPGFAAAFLDRLRPAAMIWAAPAPRPILMDEALGRGLRPIVVGGPREADIERVGRRVARHLFEPARRALASGFAEAQALSRLGVPAPPREIVGPLQARPLVRPVDEGRRAALAGALAGRPVWLAAGTPGGMVRDLLDAQTELRRRAHRAILILETAAPPPPDADGVLRTSGGDGALPDVGISVLIVPPGETGLWARLASVTLLAGTLAGEGADPMLPAALGSAVIHGGPHGALDAAGGAVRIGSVAQVAAAVEDLLAPDRAAVLARAGWELATDGAEATDRLVAEILAAVDEAPAGAAA
ncbi:MAG: glycosyltransferase N-terminal domain-containing protein [Hasllibacter sp.]